MKTMPERTIEPTAEEVVALTAMWRDQRALVPAGVFMHPGYRAWATHWERTGKVGMTEADRAAASQLAAPEDVQRAEEDIRLQAQLVMYEAEVRDACSTLTRRRAEAAALADVKRLDEAVWKGEAPPEAMAAAWQRLADSRRTAMPTPFRTAGDAMRQLLEEARKRQGKPMLGINLPSMAKFTKRLDGMRGLAFMAGEPGTGKTSLAMQMAFDAAEGNADTVAVVLTCEMSVTEVSAYAMTRKADIDFLDLMRGQGGMPEDPDMGLRLAPVALDALRDEQAAIDALGPRMLVYTPADFGGAFVGHGPAGRDLFAPLVDVIRRAKDATGATRAMLVMDNLQGMPVAEPLSGSTTGWRGEHALERDRYAIAEMNALTDHVDAALVISEQAKSDQGKASITAMLGTGRSGYAADAVIMLTDPAEYANKRKGKGGDADEDTSGDERRQADYAKGHRKVDIRLVKGRAGMDRGTTPATFLYRRHMFTEQG
jgi:hypothetical protein